MAPSKVPKPLKKKAAAGAGAGTPLLLLDDSLFQLVCSHVREAGALGQLAQASSRCWSVAQEAARLRVEEHCRTQNEVCSLLRGPALRAWLPLLAELEAPRVFTFCTDPHMAVVLDDFFTGALSNGGSTFNIVVPNGTVTNDGQYTAASRQAVCGRPMRGGTHQAEFTTTHHDGNVPSFTIGVIDQRSFALENEAPINELDPLPVPVSGRVTESGYIMGRPGVYGWDCEGTVFISHEGGSIDSRWVSGTERGYGPGKTVALRLDLDAGRLEAFQGGRRLGSLVEGLRLVGSFCWFVWIYCEGYVGRQAASVTMTAVSPAMLPVEQK